ncbi:MAG: hypothetical protein KGI11_08550 [Thaumarchaeota archaeon]|nr:hypothetical protein [Nitrososphaerota archaeon]
MYKPDLWTILKVGDGAYKIAASWRGGYLSGDSWRLSSGIKKIIDLKGGYWEVTNNSGSVYLLHKKSVGMSWFTESEVKNCLKTGELVEVNIKDILEEFSNE